MKLKKSSSGYRSIEPPKKVANGGTTNSGPKSSAPQTKAKGMPQVKSTKARNWKRHMKNVTSIRSKMPKGPKKK